VCLVSHCSPIVSHFSVQLSDKRERREEMSAMGEQRRCGEIRSEQITNLKGLSVKISVLICMYVFSSACL
jgi:hypothetical protein